MIGTGSCKGLHLADPLNDAYEDETKVDHVMSGSEPDGDEIEVCKARFWIHILKCLWKTSSRISYFFRILILIVAHMLMYLQFDIDTLKLLTWVVHITVCSCLYEDGKGVLQEICMSGTWQLWNFVAFSAYITFMHMKMMNQKDITM